MVLSKNAKVSPNLTVALLGLLYTVRSAYDTHGIAGRVKGDSGKVGYREHSD